MRLNAEDGRRGLLILKRIRTDAARLRTLIESLPTAGIPALLRRRTKAGRAVGVEHILAADPFDSAQLRGSWEEAYENLIAQREKGLPAAIDFTPQQWCDYDSELTPWNCTDCGAFVNKYKPIKAATDTSHEYRGICEDCRDKRMGITAGEEA